MCLQGELDELEREEFFRLKKVQAKKKRDAADKDQAVLQVCCKLFAAACSHLWVMLDCHSHSLVQCCAIHLPKEDGFQSTCIDKQSFCRCPRHCIIICRLLSTAADVILLLNAEEC